MLLVEFGRSGNQISHTFRHTDSEGFKRVEVKFAILAHLRSVEDVILEGPYTAHVQVKGVHLEFRAYKFNNGDIHVGRITIP